MNRANFPINHVLIASWLLLFCYACGGQKQIDREAIKEEMKIRELKRITESEIQLEGEKIGNEYLKLEEKAKIEFIESYKLVFDSLLWDQNVPDSTLKAILEVYDYAHQEGQKMAVGVQGSDQKNLYFCSPLKEDENYTGVMIVSIPRKYLIINYEN